MTSPAEVQDAGSYDLLIVQGQRYQRGLTWERRATPEAELEPVDMTGYEVEAQIRSRAGASSIVLDLQDYITITDAEAGEFEIDLPASVTRDLPAKSMRWDAFAVSLSDSDTAVRFLQGRVRVTASVTVDD